MKNQYKINPFWSFFMLLHDGLDNYTTVRNMEIISFVSTLKSMSFEITQHRQTFRFLPPRYCANAVSATAILSVCLSVMLKLWKCDVQIPRWYIWCITYDICIPCSGFVLGRCVGHQRRLIRLTALGWSDRFAHVDVPIFAETVVARCWTIVLLLAFVLPVTTIHRQQAQCTSSMHTDS